MNKDTHPAQDPVEGSRATVERDLRQQEEKAKQKADTDTSQPKPEPGSEAAEPSPE